MSNNDGSNYDTKNPNPAYPSQPDRVPNSTPGPTAVNDPTQQPTTPLPPPQTTDVSGYVK
jgi:hypothetical protein